MLWPEFRASLYRIGTILFGVLAVALLIGCMFLWNRATRADVRADAESARAQASEARAKALSDALARDSVSQSVTDVAQHATDESAATINARLARLEARKNDRPPVPAVCPGPDADLVRESAEAGGRFRSAEGRLRNLRLAEGQPAR